MKWVVEFVGLRLTCKLGHLRKTNKQTKLIPDNSQYKKAAVAVFWFRIPTAATQKNLGLTAVLNNVFFRLIYIVVLLQHSSSFHPSILTPWWSSLPTCNVGGLSWSISTTHRGGNVLLPRGWCTAVLFFLACLGAAGDEILAAARMPLF